MISMENYTSSMKSPQDLGIALAEAGRMGLSLPGLALANQLYLAVQACCISSDRCVVLMSAPLGTRLRPQGHASTVSGAAVAERTGQEGMICRAC